MAIHPHRWSRSSTRDGPFRILPHNLLQPKRPKRSSGRSAEGTPVPCLPVLRAKWKSSMRSREKQKGKWHGDSRRRCGSEIRLPKERRATPGSLPPPLRRIRRQTLSLPRKRRSKPPLRPEEASRRPDKPKETSQKPKLDNIVASPSTQPPVHRVSPRGARRTAAADAGLELSTPDRSTPASDHSPRQNSRLVQVNATKRAGNTNLKGGHDRTATTSPGTPVSVDEADASNGSSSLEGFSRWGHG